jgi:hypothetical protein
MKNPKRRTTPRSKAAPSRRATKGWSLVRVNQRPLRRKTASECSRELARVEKARAEWRRFEREDRPAFEQWMASHFGAALTEIRELERALRDRESLIDEVEIEYAWIGAHSFRAAYLSVMRRRDAPARPRITPPEDADRQQERHFSDFSADEKRAVFEEFVEDYFDLDPEDLSKKEYQRMYKEFEAGVRKGGRKSTPPPQHEKAARPEDARLKEMYRVLVRRLHPDTRADGDPEVSALWHEVQEAYQGGKVERLEMLLALTDIRSKSAGEHTSLYQMREVLAELRAAFQALQKSLRDARREPAWNFSRGVNRDAIEARLQRRFNADLAARRKRLRECEALIARWARPPKSKRIWVSDLQVEFAF